MTAGIGSSPPRDPTNGLDGIENGWMDVSHTVLRHQDSISGVKAFSDSSENLAFTAYYYCAFTVSLLFLEPMSPINLCEKGRIAVLCSMVESWQPCE